MKTQDQLTIEALRSSLVEKERLLDDAYEQRNALCRLPAGIKGTYYLQDIGQLTTSDLVEEPFHWHHSEDNFMIKWSKNARFKFRIPPFTQMSGYQIQGFPRQVNADSWWHLCAQVGIIEPIARLFYKHPEDGQESAVAKAKPVQRGPIIACQGDFLP